MPTGRLTWRSTCRGAGAGRPAGERGTFGRHLDHVYATGRAGIVDLDGQNVFVYRAASEDEVTVDFCVGVKAPFTAVGSVQPLQTPHGVAAMTRNARDIVRGLDVTWQAIVGCLQSRVSTTQIADGEEAMILQTVWGLLDHDLPHAGQLSLLLRAGGSPGVET